MADNPIVSNSYVANNPDIPVRTTQVTNGTQVQHVRLDFGTGTAESIVTAANPLPVSGTFTGGGGGPIEDGVSSSIKATVKDYSNSNPLTVVLTDTSGDPYVASGSGGTQYTEGDVDASVTGTAIMWRDAGDVMEPVTASTPLPIGGTVTVSGVATAANQASEIALLTTIDGDTGSIATTNATIAGAVSGTEMQVDVVTMPAISGSVTVSGSVTANAGTNLNTSALALESTLSTLNGKVTACNTGAVTISSALPAGTNNIGDVDVISMPTVTVQATNLDIRDLTSASDSVAAVQSGSWVLGANSGVDIGDVTINNAAGASAVNIQDGGNTITVDGTVNAAQSGTWNINNVSGTVSLPTGASSLAEQQTQTTALQLLDNTVNVHDSAATTSLTQIGGKAYASSALPSVVSSNDAVISTHDLQGRQVIAPHTAAPLDAYLALTSNAENTLIAAPGAGQSIYITSITNTASGGAALFAYRKGTGGGIFLVTGVPGVTSMGHANFPTPYKVGDNTLVTVAPSVATATQTSVTYYIAAA